MYQDVATMQPVLQLYKNEKKEEASYTVNTLIVDSRFKNFELYAAFTFITEKLRGNLIISHIMCNNF